MGSKGEKKSGLVGEKSHTVYSANWKLDALLEKELGMLDTSKRRVEHRISMDQVITKNRFERKLHHSKVFHARMKGDRAMLQKLITRDNYNFNTNTSSADVMNKRRDKDLEKKRIQHRVSQDKLMTLRSPTPGAATPRGLPEAPSSISTEAGNGMDSSLVNGRTVKSNIRPMTAIERISQAKIVAGKANKLRPVTAVATNISRFGPRSSSESIGLPSRSSTTTEIIPETSTSKEKENTDSLHTRKEFVKEPRKILIEITKADEDQLPVTPDNAAETVQTSDHIVLGNEHGLSDTSQTSIRLVDDHGLTSSNLKDNISEENKPKSSSLRPSTATTTKSRGPRTLRPTTAHGVRSQSKRAESSVSEPPDTGRSRTSITICEPISSDQSDNESHASGYRSRSSRSGRRKSSKACRKKSAASIFNEEKEITIKDIDDDRRKRSKHEARINDYLKTIEDVKTDPDLIVDYYMARLLEESSISASKKNVERIRDMPDSEYDKDLSKRSIGDLKANTITFRDVNRKYNGYKHDPYTPLHPTSMGFGLLSRSSTIASMNRQESKISLPTSAWHADESDSDST